VVVPLAKPVPPGRHRTDAEVEPAFQGVVDDDPRRLADRVGTEDPKPPERKVVQGSGRCPEAVNVPERDRP